MIPAARLILAVGATLLSVMFLVTPSHAASSTSCHDPHFAVWPGGWADGSYSYAINTRGMPGGAATARAIRRGHTAWSRLAGGCASAGDTAVRSHYAGRTSARFGARPDGINTVDFGDMAEIGLDNATTLAYTQTWWGPDGHIIESDQRYNIHLPWSTNGRRGTFDVQSVATHETGHTLGIRGDYQEVEHRTLAMAAGIRMGDRSKRRLGLGDVLAVQALYGR